MKRFVLGVGTGRCGTDSLASLLDIQTGASVTHERFGPQVPWGTGGYDWLRHLTQERPPGRALYGDVALYWLPQIERLLTDPALRDVARGLRVVALRRGQAATVESYMKKTEGPDGRNHWMNHDGSTYTPCKLGWDQCYPKFRAEDKREALSMYWAAYYGEVDRLTEKYPAQVQCFDMNALNSRGGQRAILQFVGIPREEQILDVGVWKNATGSSGPSSRSTVRSRLKTLSRKLLPPALFS